MKNTKYTRLKNMRQHNESDHQEKHSTTTEGEVAVNDEGEGEGEGGVIIIEDHKSENNNNEEAVEEKKEAVEKAEEAKVEATPSKQQLGERKQGHKKEPLSNDVIEETASKLLEARKNKVRALAGAFQTVIDHQTTSK
ncbi:calmodulin binding [Spatholobus suberectus]|nr:calmodulin binding [Spatholobus suberectus]